MPQKPLSELSGRQGFRSASETGGPSIGVVPRRARHEAERKRLVASSPGQWEVRLAQADELDRISQLLQERHYLGGIRPVGERLYYAASDGQGEWLQHLASIRMLFDWLMVGGTVRLNPADPVRGPKQRSSP